MNITRAQSRHLIVQNTSFSRCVLTVPHLHHLPARSFASKRNLNHRLNKLTNRISQNAKKETAPVVKVVKDSKPVKPHQAISFSQANKLHPRTHWYMCAVPGLTDGPTALGHTPAEYLPTRVFVDSIDAPVPKDTKILRSPPPTPGEEESHRRTYPTDYYYYAPAVARETCPFASLSVHGSELAAMTQPRVAVTAFSVAQTPPVRSHTRDVEIMFTGRSNVGKSSLLNSLTQSTIAHASQKPGKTQSLNFYAIGAGAMESHRGPCDALAYASQVDPFKQNAFLDALKWGLDEPMTPAQKETFNETVLLHGNAPIFYLVDVPGYGFARAPKAVVDHWNALIGGYVRLRSPTRYPLASEFRARYDEEIAVARRARRSMRVSSDDGVGESLTAEEKLEKAEKQAAAMLMKVLKDLGVPLDQVTAQDLVNVGVQQPERMLERLRAMEAEGDKAEETKTQTPKKKKTAKVLPPVALENETHGSPLKLAIVLIDPKLGLQKQDVNFMDFLEAFRVPYQVVITKNDRVGRAELEGVALSIAQTLFPHVYVGVYARKNVDETATVQPAITTAKLVQKEEKNEDAAETEEGDILKPAYTMSANEDAVWSRANNQAPRKYCSPLLLSVSSETKEGLLTLKKTILNAAYAHI